MATQQRAMVVGVENVVSVWETLNDNCPYFAVWYNRNDKWFQFNGDDIVKAKSFLSDNLEAVADQGDNYQYYLKIYPTYEKNYSRSGEIAAIGFRLNPYHGSQEVGAIGAYTGGSDTFAKMYKDAVDKHELLVKEIAELKAANQPLDWFDRIGGLLETPGAAGAIVPIIQPILGSIMGIVNKIAGVQPATFTNPGIAGASIVDNGLDKDALIDNALDRLEKHGDLIEMLTSLADFADKNPAMFKMYFDGLKSQL